MNSTLFDAQFREFFGHTQVNATDLRSMKYPGCDTLMALGARIKGWGNDQHAVDALILDFDVEGNSIESSQMPHSAHRFRSKEGGNVKSTYPLEHESCGPLYTI